ncbi:MAG: hypothetical protein ACOYXT_11135 [Bacteroidota bacterium]
MAQRITISQQRIGTYQSSLVPQALSAKHFLLDERDESALLAYLAEVASAFIYVEPSGKANGSWQRFLLSDPLMLCAYIMHEDTEASYTTFLDLAVMLDESANEDFTKQFVDPFFQEGFQVIKRIDRWYTWASQNLRSNVIRDILKSEIETNGRDLLADFYASYVGMTEAGSTSDTDPAQLLMGLNEVWKFNPARPVPHDSDWTTQAISGGQSLFVWMADVVKEIRQQWLSQRQREDMPAHIGLLMAFLDLYKAEQEALNSITQRHLDFYFQDVLHGIPAKAIPNKTSVILQLAKDVTSVSLASGTVFSAGKDLAEKEMLYATRQEQLITPTKIQQCSTLLLPPVQANDVSTGCHVGTVSDLNGPGCLWPLFGSPDSISNLQVNDAALGFAFSCADLLLAQGKRAITITIGLRDQKEAQGNFPAQVTDWNLSLTTPEGWFQPLFDPPVYSSLESAFTFTFYLEAGDPAVVSYQSKLHGAGYDTSWPVCKIQLTESGVAIYRTLSNLVVASVNVTTKADHIYDFILENDAGKLSAALPFIPYTIPAPGANLYIGSQEFFAKPLTSFYVVIDWENLPPKGFQNYYQAYNDYYQANLGTFDLHAFAFFNQTFQAKVFMLSGERWVEVTGDDGNPPAYCLFTNEVGPDSGEWPLVSKGEKTIQLSFDTSTFPFDAALQPFTALNNTLREGFFCITLSAPDKGFGAVDYPTVVSTIAMQNSEAAIHNAQWYRRRKETIKPLPNIPFVPRISGMEVGYTSSQTYYCNDEAQNIQWYHLHPMGVEQKAFTSAITLLPLYAQMAYALLALDKPVINATLSIYFSLQYRISSVDSSSSEGTTYEYYSTSGWQPLTVLSDQTFGFQCSGIITFNVPQDIINVGGGVPDGLYWIRFGQNTLTGVKASYVATQAVEVYQVLSEDISIEAAPAQAIQSLKVPVPAIKSIFQPEAAVGGRPAEQTSTFQRSTSMRLKYRSRAITSADIEGLLLTQFPDLFQVTVLPAGEDTNMKRQVNIYLVPYAKTSAGLYAWWPMTPLPLMLNVLSFVQECSTPHTEYKVANPVFEVVQVHCQVVFSTQGDELQRALQLNNELQYYLSPWIKDNPLNAVPVRASAQTIYAFVRSREYVKDIVSFSCEPNSPAGASAPSTDVPAKSPVVLQVTAMQHDIRWTGADREQDPDPAPPGLRIGETYYLTN